MSAKHAGRWAVLCKHERQPKQNAVRWSSVAAKGRACDVDIDAPVRRLRHKVLGEAVHVRDLRLRDQYTVLVSKHLSRVASAYLVLNLVR